MNFLDVFILLIMVASFVYSLFRGLVREVFSLLSLILGFISATRIYHIPAGLILRGIDNLFIANVLGFTLVFIFVSIGISLIGKLIKKFVRHVRLELIDRILGAFFGLLKGAFVVIIIVVVLIAFLPPAHPVLSKSRLSPYFMTIGELSLRMIPGDFRLKVKKKRESLSPYWRQLPDNHSTETKEGETLI